MKVEEEIQKLIRGFDGEVCIWAEDEKKNQIQFHENKVVESASCIKLFILMEYYRQVYLGIKNQEDRIPYQEEDFIQQGSGITRFLDFGLTMTSKNWANLMIMISDNVATNLLIKYLGRKHINNTIQQLGLKNTELLVDKIDFALSNQVGKTTAKEYGLAYKKLQKGEFIDSEVCNQILEVLKKQQETEMLTRYLPDSFFKSQNEEGVIVSIASKCGELSGTEQNHPKRCDNDGGIIETEYGWYIVSVFMQDFKLQESYYKNEAVNLGARINELLLKCFIKNKGSFRKA